MVLGNVGASEAASHVPGRSDLRQTEVEDLRLAALGDEEIRRLEIPVDDARTVRRIERIGDLLAQRQHLLDRQRLALDRVLEGLPCIRSITRKGFPSWTPMSYTVQMWGWLRAEAARASRLKRSRASGDSAVSSGRNFTATRRPSSVSSAS